MAQNKKLRFFPIFENYKDIFEKPPVKIPIFIFIILSKQTYMLWTNRQEKEVIGSAVLLIS